MYEYRTLSDEEKQCVFRQRIRRGHPAHRPPHPDSEKHSSYLLTGACFNHASILHSPERREEWLQKLRALASAIDAGVYAWVVLPNHWHLLASLELHAFSTRLSRLYNGTSTQWNREDQTPGRKTWYAFSDRRIRGERHYFAALNYIHSNPLRHGLVERSADWPHSSLHQYLEDLGPGLLGKLWHSYPVDRMGENWD